MAEGRPLQTRTLTLAVIREEDRYVAQCLEVDVSSFGDTQEEAIAMITEALELWFDDAIAPPPVEHPIVTSVDVRVPA